MPLLAAVNVQKIYGVDVILDRVSLSLEAGERIGLVGRNGEGKSTLLKIISGDLAPDSGEVNLARGRRVGRLEQDPTFDPTETLRDSAEGAFAELHDLHAQQHKLFDEMAAAGDDAARLEKLMARQSVIERRIEALGGYAIDHTIDATLHGVGLTDAEFGVKVGSLSGGQRGRLALARLLLENPDVLLLDEPTNHLDIQGREWLESWLLEEFRGAAVIVSHDRRLLQRVVTRIVEVERGRLIDYPGGYDAFREIRAQRRLTQLRAYEKQQTKFKQEQAFIDRYRAGQRAKQAKGRESRLDRERADATLERPMEVSAMRLALPEAPRSGDMVAAVRGLTKTYANENGGTRVLFKEFDLTITRGERWGVIGPNGAGKTTLVRTMLGEITPDAGSARLGSNVLPGYYRQTHEGLNPETQIYRYLQKRVADENPGAQWSEQRARDLAGAFLFSGDEQEKQLGVLSGGERSRVVLAGLLASAKNLLILDEPTNHLDIPSAERLEEALGAPPSRIRERAAVEGGEELQEGAFDGTLILISHDRALIDALCDRLIVLDGEGNAALFMGNYSEWDAARATREKAAREAELAERDAREKAEKQRRAAEEAKRAASAPKQPGSGGRGARSSLERMTTEQIEAKIETLESKVREIDAKLADPDVWRDSAKSAKLGDERTKVLAELEPLEFEWSRRAEQS